MSYYFAMVKNYLCNFVFFIITNAVFYMNKFVLITVCLCGVKCVCARACVGGVRKEERLFCMSERTQRVPHCPFK